MHDSLKILPDHCKKTTRWWSTRGLILLLFGMLICSSLWASPADAGGSTCAEAAGPVPIEYKVGGWVNQSDHPDDWYMFDVPSDGDLTINVENFFASSTDLIMILWDGCSAGDMIDSWSLPDGQDHWIRDIPVMAGRHYLSFTHNGSESGNCSYNWEVYWVPSNEPPNTPTSPDPNDDATNVSVSTDLDWSCSDPNGDTVYYTVCFEKDDPTPDNVIKNDSTGSSADPGSLDNDSHYYWQVKADDHNGGVKMGPVWDFYTQSDETDPTWVVMYYFAHGGDLDQHGVEKKNRIDSATGNDDFQAYILWDRLDPGDADQVYLMQDGNDDTWTGPDIGLPTEFDMGDTVTLVTYVDWVMDRTDADNYALVLFDHGSGIDPTGFEGKLDPTTLGICWDGASYLSVYELGIAMDSIYNMQSRSMDVVHLDACLMQMVEVGYQMSFMNGAVDYIVASENLGWALGSSYEDDYLVGINTSTDPLDLATSIAQAYDSACDTEGLPHTVSVLAQSEIFNIVSKLDDLAGALISDFNNVYSELDTIRTHIQKFDSNGSYTITDSDDYLDLKDLAIEVNDRCSSASVRTAASALSNAIGNEVGVFVKYEDHLSGSALGTNYDFSNGTYGLSVFWPDTSDSTYDNYIDTTSSGSRLALCIDTNWDQFLHLYFDGPTCGTMELSQTSWDPNITCGDVHNLYPSVSASGGDVLGVTASKITGPSWLTVSPASLGDISSGSSEVLTITASPPLGTDGSYPYTIQVSNTCGNPSSIDVTGTITVPCDDHPEYPDCTSVGMPSTTDGVIEVQGDYDWFCSNVQAGIPYRAEVVEGSLSSGYVRVHRQNGQTIGSSPEGDFTWTSEYTEGIFVEVWGSGIGSYQLELTGDDGCFLTVTSYDDNQNNQWEFVEAVTAVTDYLVFQTIDRNMAIGIVTGYLLGYPVDDTAGNICGE